MLGLHSYNSHQSRLLAYFANHFFRGMALTAKVEFVVDASDRNILDTHHAKCRRTMESMPLQNVLQGNNHIKQLVKHGRVMEAHQVFWKMNIRDVYSWTALLSGYVNYGKAEEALRFFCHMQKEKVLPNKVTFICALKACVVSLSLEWGKDIHGLIMELGLELDMYVGSCLVDMYAK
eukprot:c9752_g1_i1 orf=375-905(+)